MKDLQGSAAAIHRAAPSSGDYGNGTYQNLCNNRSTTRQAENMGGVQGMIKANSNNLMFETNQEGKCYWQSSS